MEPYIGYIASTRTSNTSFDILENSFQNYFYYSYEKSCKSKYTLFAITTLSLFFMVNFEMHCINCRKEFKVGKVLLFMHIEKFCVLHNCISHFEIFVVYLFLLWLKPFCKYYTWFMFICTLLVVHICIYTE